MMKKYLLIVCGAALVLSLCACGNAVTSFQKETGHAGNNSTAPQAVNPQHPEKESQAAGGLTMLAGDPYAHCNTENGYYYITEDETALRSGGYAAHLMYMDFETQQEVYLCSNAGCTHNDESCTAVLPDKDFVLHSSRIFTWNGNLYILSKEYDSDGSVTVDLMGGEPAQEESIPASLYQMNLDGTDRKRIFTFGDGITLEECIFADEGSIYFITKKLETSIDGNTSVTSSTERTLVSFTPATRELETLLSMDFGDDIIWQPVGCYDHSLVLEGISYANGSDVSASMSQDQWEEIYGKSESVFAVLSLNNGVLNTVYQIQNSGIHSSETLGGCLYVSEESTCTIKKIDLCSGSTTSLANIPQSNIVGAVGDKLICRTWDMIQEYALYFVDTDSGEVNRCGLVNECNGWPLEVMGETQRDAIVVYDYQADAHLDGSYEIHQYKFALIPKEDLYTGNRNYRPIQMVGKGR